MTKFSIKMTSFFKESNNLFGSTNSLAWKKRTYLILIENEFVEHVEGSITKIPKEETQAQEKYMQR